MGSRIQSTFPSASDIQTMQPRLQLHGPVLLLLFIGTLPLFLFVTHGVPRIFYLGLSVLAISAVLFQFNREYRLVHDRLTAVGVVTDYRIPCGDGPRIVRFFMRKFYPDVPVIKYSFFAFDQKTYTGQTGWRVRNLFKGAKVTVLYRPGKPSVNHPVTSFIFYSLG